MGGGGGGGEAWGRGVGGGGGQSTQSVFKRGSGFRGRGLNQCTHQ